MLPRTPRAWPASIPAAGRILLALASAALVVSCSSSDGDAAFGDELIAHVASYDVAATGPQRFLLGLTTPDQGLVVGGSVDLRFQHLGDGSNDDAPVSEPVAARFISLGDGPAPASDEPHAAGVGETNGVYEAQGVTFAEPGVWEVTTTVRLGEDEATATGAFNVVPTHEVPAAGEAAPRSANPVADAVGVDPVAIDSRANDGVIPDPLLHSVSIADAIATGRPSVVVISTPVYCVSRFCGPITDVVDRLAQAYAQRASFVHLEVWQDFEANQLNPAAAEWVVTSDGGAEPWVFLIDGTGTIVRRWDNVTNGADLEAALVDQLNSTG